MVIHAGGLNIKLELVYEKEFINLSNYKTKEEAEFFIYSSLNFPQIKQKKLIEKTTYYDLYETELGKLQLQKYQSKYIGAILYNDKKAYIYPMVGGFTTEYLLTQYAFVNFVTNYKNGLFIHSSAISYHDSGILFLAKSGTGKSTQRNLWVKYGQAICINDDKNVITLAGNDLKLEPNPWSGKHFLDTNKSVFVKVLVFIYQNKENVITKLKKEEVLKLLLGQIPLPSEKQEANWNLLVDKLLDLPLIHYGCNMEEEAYLKLKNYLEGEHLI